MLKLVRTQISGLTAALFIRISFIISVFVLVHQLPYKNNKASDTASNPDQLSQQQRFTAEGVFVCFVLSLALQGAGISQQTSSSRAEERG